MGNETKANEISGRTVNVKRNIVYGLMQFIVSHVFPFIVRTILIYRFGVDYIGLNSLFASILSVLSLMDLGFGTAVVYSMYKPVAEGDTAQICAYLSYYRKMYRLVGVAILAIGLLLMPFLTSFIKDQALPGELNLYVCYILFLIDAVISYLFYGYMTAIPTAYQRMDILSRVNMGMILLKCVMQSLILLSFSSFYLYLLSIPLLTIVRNLMIACVVRKKYPALKCNGEISFEQKNNLKRKVYGVFINKMTNISRNSIDSLCISFYIGLAMTGMYNNYYYVMAGALSLSVMVCISMLPSVGNSIATESRAKNYYDMRLFDFIFMSIAGWTTTCLLCLCQPFIQTWVGEKMMLGTSVVVGISFYFYILVSGSIQWLYHQGAGLWWECRYIMLGEAVANIVLNFVLCKIMGILGIILATILTVFATNCLFCPRLLFKLYFKNAKLQEYWSDHACYALTMLLTAGFSWFVCERGFPISMVAERQVVDCILCIVGRTAICLALSVLVFWFIWHRSERYLKAVGWIKKIANFL